ncbi:MAG: hypothetical protein MZV49_24540 [Rhodopseudomonas palustris]|nr:hypothetical protein [Rhodopseudomonas palustris]
MILQHLAASRRPAPMRPGRGRWMVPASCGPIPVGARVFGCRQQRGTGRHSAAPRRWPAPPGGQTRPAPDHQCRPAPRAAASGFGAALGTLTTCACSRLEFSDGSAALLIVTAEPVPRPMPLVERLRSPGRRHRHPDRQLQPRTARCSSAPAPRRRP